MNTGMNVLKLGQNFIPQIENYLFVNVGKQG